MSQGTLPNDHLRPTFQLWIVLRIDCNSVRARRFELNPTTRWRPPLDYGTERVDRAKIRVNPTMSATVLSAQGQFHPTTGNRPPPTWLGPKNFDWAAPTLQLLGSVHAGPVWMTGQPWVLPMFWVRSLGIATHLRSPTIRTACISGAFRTQTTISGVLHTTKPQNRTSPRTNPLLIEV